MAGALPRLHKVFRPRSDYLTPHHERRRFHIVICSRRDQVQTAISWPDVSCDDHIGDIVFYTFDLEVSW